MPSASDRLHANHASTRVQDKCRLCRCSLDVGNDDDLVRLLCGSCKSRPEARRLGIVPVHSTTRTESATTGSKAARAFTVAEKALIRKVHGYMPAQQLLDILNERLTCDLGPDVIRYTMDQLYSEIGDVAGAVPVGGHDWASLRKLLASARRTGALNAVTEQIINDFSVVFSVNPKQLLSLKDIILQAKEE